MTLELCLLRYEAISIPNIFIRHSSSGLFAAGVKEIRWVYCGGSLSCIFKIPLGIAGKYFHKKIAT
jgi:hypothetical protein